LIIELLKAAPRYCIPVAIVCAILAFSPKEFLETIGVAKYAVDYKNIIGITLIVCVVFISIEIVKISFKRLRKINISRKRNRVIDQRLRSLTEYEKQVLRFYWAKQTRTNPLDMRDGVVQGLVRAGVIEPVAGPGMTPYVSPYNLTEVAWQIINKRPALLNGETNFMITHGPDRYS
jgi:hypothetical protein